MADAPAVEKVVLKCLQTGVTLRRKKRYYRNGNYFINKAAFKAHTSKQAEKKAEEASAPAAEAPKA